MFNRKSVLVFIAVVALALHASQSKSTAERGEKKTILFMGNSLAAGYGLNPELAFPALIQQKIDSLKWRYEVVNAGLSGETSAGGLRRIDWLLRRKIDVLVLELGGNDALRGIAIDVTRKNLQGIIDKAKRAYPQVKMVIAGMQAPPNLGPNYTRQFRDLFPQLAQTNDATLIPFLLEGVGGVPELNQADRIHPTSQGHRIIAETVWRKLKPVLSEVQ
ncbi:MAG TPA: arylesterase [bacterium]